MTKTNPCRLRALSHAYRHAAAALVSLAALCGSLEAWAFENVSSVPIGGRPPLVLEKSIKIPNIPMWPYSDVLALDLRGGRIFATPQGAKAVAVLSITDNRLLTMITGFKTLQGVYYSSQLRRLFVADDAGELKIFDGDNYALLKDIHLAEGVDGIVYDPLTKLVYVSNGGKDAGMDHAVISVIDPVTMSGVVDISVAAAGLESMVVDSGAGLLYVSLVDNNAIGVISLKSRREIARWKLPAGNHYPFALAMDVDHKRLYVTSRDDMTGLAVQGTLFVLNTDNGRVMGALPIGGWADGVLLDRKRSRVYVTTGVGRIDTYSIEPNDKYRRLPAVESPLVAKHGVYSEELDRLFVDAPHMSRAGAQVLVFRPMP